MFLERGNWCWLAKPNTFLPQSYNSFTEEILLNYHLLHSLSPLSHKCRNKLKVSFCSPLVSLTFTWCKSPYLEQRKWNNINLAYREPLSGTGGSTGSWGKLPQGPLERKETGPVVKVSTWAWRRTSEKLLHARLQFWRQWGCSPGPREEIFPIPDCFQLLPALWKCLERGVRWGAQQLPLFRREKHWEYEN